MKILITGGTNGVGKGVAKILASIDNQTHEIIILCRSKELGEIVRKELVEKTSNEKISIVLCDLAKLSDVKNAVREIQEKHKFLDAVFINAGIGYAAKRIETEDGFDAHFQVNYLSQFMLSLNLLDLLEKSVNGGRIIFNATRMGEIFWDDMQIEKNGIMKKAFTKLWLLKECFSPNYTEYIEKIITQIYHLSVLRLQKQFGLTN
jgi:NAD(P)-dependent dehydrogenase (short-subunit alcohol dehydrogenase family)